MRTAKSFSRRATQARSRRPRHGSSQDLRLRDCTATAAPADDQPASSSDQLDRRAARGIWTAGEPIVNLLTVERASWSRTGSTRSTRPDWPAAAPSRRLPADLLPASRELLRRHSRAVYHSAVYRQSFSSAMPAPRQSSCLPRPACHAHELARPPRPPLIVKQHLILSTPTRDHTNLTNPF